MSRIYAMAVLLAMLPCHAFTPDDFGEEVMPTPTYMGRDANAPIPPKYHLRNEGGSDDAGLCVIASIIVNGQWQGIPALKGGKNSELWRAAKRMPGGYGPEKLEDLLHKVMPNEEWISWESAHTDLIKRYSDQGYPVAATMNTGALYGYLPIHHMISLIHLDKDLACVVDSNDPGKYHWMPATEYEARFVDGQTGWGFIWVRKRSYFAQWSIEGVFVVISITSIFVGLRRRCHAERNRITAALVASYPTG